MLVTTIGVLRRRHADTCFNVMSYYPEQDSRLIRDPSVRVYDARPLALVTQHLPFAVAMRLARAAGARWPSSLMPASVRALSQSDVLVDLGGISFADGRAAFLPFNILCVYPAMLLGVPVVKLAQAVGPFQDWRTRAAANLFLKRCAYVVARGGRTLGHLQEIGMSPCKHRLAADVAFGYEPGFSLSQENEVRVREVSTRLDEVRRRGVRVIGMCPSTVVAKIFANHGRKYVDLIADVSQEVLSGGSHLVVLPNATRQGSSGPRNNDLTVIAELRAELGRRLGAGGSGQVTWVEVDLNTRGVREIVSRTDALVTSRFHAMIAALATHTPVVVIGWSHKYIEVLEVFGLERYVADHSSSAEEVSTLLCELLAQSESTRTRIARILPEVRASALAQFELVESAVA
jgi:polysaccharide pyruvyl transferase WcaK-like protein